MNNKCTKCGSTEVYQDFCFSCSEKKYAYSKTAKCKVVQANSAARRAIARRDGIKTKDVISDVSTSWLYGVYLSTTHCIYCGVRMVSEPHLNNSKTIDHTLAISKMGSHSRLNVRYICWQCNRDKRALLELDFVNKKLEKILEIINT